MEVINSRFATKGRLLAIAALMGVSTWALAAQERPQDIKPGDGLKHARGELVSPVFEGWFRDESGTLILSFGY